MFIFFIIKMCIMRKNCIFIFNERVYYIFKEFLINSITVAKFIFIWSDAL